MCGISGILRMDGGQVQRDHLVRFTDAMTHRGPDGAGYELYDDGKLGLGHRRLSILDLSELGHQPMQYAGHLHMTYNGEVYNFAEVRKELADLGHLFKSDTDTEVILAAYLQWGKSCLDKFNGMWAFAIWDDQKKELFLARDRFGIKPLYYLHEPEKRFAFASETRAFKFLEGFVRTFDKKLLDLNLKDPYALEGIGYTPFSNILQLLPGHCMIIKAGAEARQKRWWHIRDHLWKQVPLTTGQQAEKFYELFRDACRVRLVSDVPVATALSGGLDSTAVYTTVSDILKKENLSRFSTDSQRAFTAVFPGLPNDEQHFAAKAAEFTGGPIEFVESRGDTLAQRIARETELADFIGSSPIAAISAVYAGMRQKGVVVSLDGHGVDEMMYGYRDMLYALYSHLLLRGTQEEAAACADVLHNMYPEGGMAAIRKRFDKELGQKLSGEKNLFRRLKRRLLPAPPADGFKPATLPPLSDDPYDFSKLPLPERMLYHEFFLHSLPALLRNFDRAGMINSIEIRMPFMDWRLVSYVFSLPFTAKLGQGFTKLVLREAMKGKMPEELRTRKFKVGIGSPLEHWFGRYMKDKAATDLGDDTLQERYAQAEKEGRAATAAREAWRRLNLVYIN